MENFYQKLADFIKRVDDKENNLQVTEENFKNLYGEELIKDLQFSPIEIGTFTYFNELENQNIKKGKADFEYCLPRIELQKEFLSKMVVCDFLKKESLTIKGKSNLKRYFELKNNTKIDAYSLFKYMDDSLKNDSFFANVICDIDGRYLTFFNNNIKMDRMLKNNRKNGTVLLYIKSLLELGYLPKDICNLVFKENFNVDQIFLKKLIKLNPDFIDYIGSGIISEKEDTEKNIARK